MSSMELNKVERKYLKQIPRKQRKLYKKTHATVVNICSHCTEDLRKKYKPPKEYKIGNFVKSTFIEEDVSTEHIWVKIEVVNENSIIGSLSNAPIKLQKIKYGDMVQVDKEDIFQYMTK